MRERTLIRTKKAFLDDSGILKIKIHIKSRPYDIIVFRETVAKILLVLCMIL